MSVPCPPFPARRLAVVAAVALWLAAAGTGFGLLEAYKAVPGAAAAAPPSWPALFDSSFPRPESEPACCPQPRP